MKKIILITILITLLLTFAVIADNHLDDFNDELEGEEDENELEEDELEEDELEEVELEEVELEEVEDDTSNHGDSQEHSTNDNGDTLYEDDFSNVIEEDIYEDIGDVELSGNAGLTPDSSFYFLENLVESVLVGDNPETALKYKEEKILELKQMVESGDQEAAKKALKRVEKYNLIIKKEVSPGIEKKVRSSSKAVKNVLKGLDNDLKGDEWDDVRDSVDENSKEEDKIALAAKISTKISDLCKALSDLDPLEYSKVCKTDDDAPRWKRDLDDQLTAKQRKEAEQFFVIMSACFENPRECRCEDISIKPFAEKCAVFAPLVADCDEGNEDACDEMEKLGDPIDLLPDYLQDVMDDLEDRYDDAKYDNRMPKECSEAGATTREACMRVMFQTHAPPECQEALEDGRINPTNEREAREACESIMFESEAPEECIEAGLKDHRKCETFMFKLDAPQECIDAGLTGSGSNDWKKCEQIRFKLDAPEECLEQGIDGTGRDDWKKCDAIRFRLDAPQECLDAGLDGTGRDDWKKCDAIKFRLDSPQECLDAGLDGTGRDDWKKCNKITFLLDAPQECQQFKDDRDPWKSCQPVQFKLDAPQECLDAGLDGTGRNDWRECEKISKDTQGHGRAEDCSFDQTLYCDDSGYCQCVDSEDYDRKFGENEDDNQRENPNHNNDNNKIDCSTIFCQEGSYCDQEKGCIVDENYRDENNFNNDGTLRPNCNSNEQLICEGDECKCVFFDEDPGDGGTPPEDSNSDEHSDSGSSDDSGLDDSGSTDSNDNSDSGSDDSGSSEKSGSEDSASSDSGETTVEGAWSPGEKVTGSAVNIFETTGSAVKIFSSGEKRFRELGRLYR
jgi:hypothetical protein